MEDELYHTPDGGQTWIQKVIPLPAGLRPYSIPEGMGLTYVAHARYLDLHFIDETSGVVKVIVPIKFEGDARELIYTTNDSGRTWAPQNGANEHPGSGLLVTFGPTWSTINHSGNTLLIDGPSRSLTYTLPKSLRDDWVLKKADFIDAEHGWLLSHRGDLLGVNGGTAIQILRSSSKPTSPNASEIPQGAPQADEVHPMIGGRTNTSTVFGLDSCGAIPPEYGRTRDGERGTANEGRRTRDSNKLHHCSGSYAHSE